MQAPLVHVNTYNTRWKACSRISSGQYICSKCALTVSWADRLRARARAADSVPGAGSAWAACTCCIAGCLLLARAAHPATPVVRRPCRHPIHANSNRYRSANQHPWRRWAAAAAAVAVAMARPVVHRAGAKCPSVLPAPGPATAPTRRRHPEIQQSGCASCRNVHCACLIQGQTPTGEECGATSEGGQLAEHACFVAVCSTARNVQDDEAHRRALESIQECVALYN